MSSPSRKAFPLRINPRLYAEIEAWAQEEFRSVNGQIEFILRQAVLKRKKTAPPSTTVDELGEDEDSDAG